MSQIFFILRQDAFALKEVGRDNVADVMLEQIKQIIRKEDKEKVLAGFALMPLQS